MGAVSVDLESSSRKLDIMFPMNTKLGVETFLENYSYIQGLTHYSADYDALILLIDFETALAESQLSAKEIHCLHEVFIMDRKRVDVAKELGVAKQTVQSWLNRSTEKLAKYYAGMEEGVFSVIQ